MPCDSQASGRITGLPPRSFTSTPKLAACVRHTGSPITAGADSPPWPRLPTAASLPRHHPSDQLVADLGGEHVLGGAGVISNDFTIACRVARAASPAALPARFAAAANHLCNHQFLFQGALVL